jgi:Protein similar to CwfJ C-terminus 1/Protein similar to CwfJ C-terminus 2
LKTIVEPWREESVSLPADENNIKCDMLNGIKIGKRKKSNKDESSRKDPPPVSSTSTASDRGDLTQQQQQRTASTSNNNNTATNEISNNYSVADQLRQRFAAGDVLPPSITATSATDGRGGRIRSYETSKRNNNDELNTIDDDSKNVVLLMDNPRSSLIYKSDPSDMTIQDMVVEERQSRYVSQSDVESQNVMRLGKKRRLKSSQQIDSDEEMERQIKMIPTLQKKQNVKDFEQSQNRDRSRQLARYDRQGQITSKCWWWIEAGTNSFQQHRLISLGNYVTLVMAPNKLSLIGGEHFYLVPIPHVESFTSCDDDVWNEIILFQRSLQTLYQKENKTVLFWETVLPNHNFWQTKMECIVVPLSIASDAQLHFRSALCDIAEEWGTHQKLIPTGGVHKELRRSIPSNFPYVYLEYGNYCNVDSSSNNNNRSTGGEGYVQMIESNDFPKDFVIDIIAGMMKMDPIRFRSNPNYNNEKKHTSEKSNTDEEKRYVSLFLSRWKSVDWTLQLDTNTKR